MNTKDRTISLKLPFNFDVNKLNEDIRGIIGQSWIPHFNTEGYEGEWKAISLLTEGGDDSNIFVTASGGSNILETKFLKESSYLKTVLDTFKSPIISARLLRLGVGAEIKPHRDYALGYEDGYCRIHIPIETNNKVEFILDGNLITMLPGECWYTNVNYIHSVSNTGQTDRIHLVIDIKRNSWTDDLFFSLAPKHTFEPEPKIEESQETKKRMIEELKQMNNPNNQNLINELEKSLKCNKYNG